MQPRQRFLKPRSSPCTGFSLVEMLVVVAIIGLLAGLSVPAIGRAKAFSQQTTCTANLRTLHQATMLYAADFDGCFPFAFGSNNYAFGLAGNIDTPGYVGLGGTSPDQRGASWGALRSQQKPFCFWCPTALPLPQPSWASYAMNACVGGNGVNYPNLKIHQVASSTKTALYMDGYFDGTGYQVCVGDKPKNFPSPAHPPNLKNQTNNPAASVNVVFVDGHVEMRRFGTIPKNLTDVFWTPSR
jgi:prepilin-type N-terminal cleavage/methylation domain-containing protein/prepilin-type processing-associated H-X9-DG protein